MVNNRIACKWGIILLLVFYIAISGARSQDYIEYKNIERKYKISRIPNYSIGITNKYGNIHIDQWNKDSVKVNIKLSIKSNEISKLHKALKEIDFEFSKTNFYFNVNTKIETSGKNFLSDIKNFVSTESEIKIDYTVTVPDYVDLKLNNKYGDVFVSDIKGNLNLILSNGIFQANNLSGDTDLDLKFSKASINSVNIGKISASYSDIQITKINQLSFDGKYNPLIAINKVNVLKTKTKRDKFQIGEINYLYGSAYFSDFTIDKFNNETSFEMKYGTLKLNSIEKTFSFININSTHARKINLLFNKECSYQIDINQENTKLIYPEDKIILKQKNTENEKILTYGTYGKLPTQSKVEINSEGCNITIVQK